MSPPVRMRGTPEEALLFRMLGISEPDREEACLLLLGVREEMPVDTDLYVRLPDPAHPLLETEQLAEALGRAVGHGGLKI
ncbi:MAG TPA: hypothetical protein VJ961_09620 [Mariprofundaceae bacterium]|nr:hypothetical protein [Mariprofundaceae bacterium]